MTKTQETQLRSMIDRRDKIMAERQNISRRQHELEVEESTLTRAIINLCKWSLPKEDPCEVADECGIA